MIFAHDVPSAVTFSEAAKLACLARGLTVLELGAHYGRSTIALASTAAMVHSVDWCMGDPQAGHGDNLAALWANLVRYGVTEKVILHVGRFEAALPLLKPDSFDMVFIDGLHTEEALESNIALARPLVRLGGIWAFHDYGRFECVERVTQREFGAPLECVDSLAILAIN